ncbi:MAG: fatty acid desaturase [Taibaiella sp.]|nr:fatty acid desaturase [Taibaiella sp.]
MLSGKELILATKPFTKEVRSKSWLYALSTLFMVICGLYGSLYIHFLPLKLLCSILTGLLIVRMFVIYHDHQHHAILYKSKLANFIMTIFGIFVLAPTSIWKRSHDYHHNHNSKLFSASIGSYPIVTRTKFLAMSTGEKRIYLLTRHPITILLGYFSMFIFGMCISSFVSSPKKHFDSLIALVLHITLSVLVFYFIGWQAWLFGIFIPFSIACCIGAYLFYAQHNFPTVNFATNSDWKYEVAALQSSSFMLMNPVMKWFTANIGYHHIHHLNSRIPFYRLPEVMAAIPELQKVKTTSLSIKDVRACFKLKVWDADTNRMIGHKDIAR